MIGLDLGVGEEVLVRWYYCSVLSSVAVEARRDGGERLGDRYTFFPKVRVMDGCLNDGGVEAFFDRDEVRGEGLSLAGFVEFVEGLDEGARAYTEKGDSWTGWMN